MYVHPSESMGLLPCVHRFCHIPDVDYAQQELQVTSLLLCIKTFEVFCEYFLLTKYCFHKIPYYAHSTVLDKRCTHRIADIFLYIESRRPYSSESMWAESISCILRVSCCFDFNFCLCLSLRQLFSYVLSAGVQVLVSFLPNFGIFSQTTSLLILCVFSSRTAFRFSYPQRVQHYLNRCSP